MFGLHNANPLWRAVMLGVLVGLTTCARARADMIIIGNPPDPGAGNVFPFGSDNTFGPATRYQQVYNQNLFKSGPITITEIDFYDTQFFVPGQRISDATYTFFLSATSKSVNGLDTTNLSNNVGANNTQVYSHFRNDAVALGDTVRFILDTPFTYDPAQGNLLLDVQRPVAGPFTSLALDERFGTFGNDSSRAHNYGSVFDSTGLVTGFQFTAQGPAVPEPTTLTLAAIGGLCLAFRGWRCRTLV
jgi:hypothetical protein